MQHFQSTTCWMVLNEIWLPSNFWSNLNQHFSVEFVWPPRSPSYDKVLLENVRWCCVRLSGALVSSQNFGRSQLHARALRSTRQPTLWRVDIRMYFSFDYLIQQSNQNWWLSGVKKTVICARTPAVTLHLLTFQEISITTAYHLMFEWCISLLDRKTNYRLNWSGWDSDSTSADFWQSWWLIKV